MRDSAEDYLTVENLRKQYGAVTAVEDVSLRVAQGTTLCLLGPSGCGKTTILRSIAGLISPTSGEIRLDGASLLDVPIHRRDIGFVFQTWALFPHLSVADNLAYGLRMRKLPSSERADRVHDMLELVGLEGLEDRRPAELSGGQQQRVALARALVTRPRLLLLDEPLSSLDLKIRQQLRYEIRRIQDRLGLTALYVTHDHSEAMALGDSVAVMSNGHVVEVGGPREIFARPRTQYVAEFLNGLNVLPVTPHASSRDGDLAVELTDGTVAEVPQRSDLVAGFRWTSVGVAPTAIRLARPDDSRSSAPSGEAWTGTVTAIELSAGHDTLSVDVKALRATLSVQQYPDDRMAVGNDVEIYIDWSQGLLLHS